ncbi:MAG: hypothetical protein R3208_10315, partial [Ketobacteraceae bacterium]|nr:hypothetical protein [Ketobacteraceae bacterium]
TLMAMGGARTVALQEKMTANTYDRSMALQAAEAALREGENIAEEQSKLSPFNDGFPDQGSYTDTDNSCPQGAVNRCANGLCVIPDKDCDDRWYSSEFNQWQTATVDVSNLAGTPDYVIEYLGGTFPCQNGAGADPMNCKRYRITAVSRPDPNRAAVMLQSIYATD